MVSTGYEETQGHLLQCPLLVRNLRYLIDRKQELEENHIYGDIEEQIQIVNVYSDILEQREILRNQKKDEDSLNMRAQCTPLVI